jgi:hypothetical protein
MLNNEETNEALAQLPPPEGETVLETSDSDDSTPPTGKSNLRWSVIIVGAVLALGALLLGWNAWQSHRAADSVSASASTSTSGAKLVTQNDLNALVGTLGHSLYWAGDQGLSTYELSGTKPNTYIRYLPSGVAAGSTDQYLTVATYEQQNAYQGLESAAKVKGAKSEKLKGGSLVVQPGDKPKSAYFAFPQANLLMEVFDPKPGHAYELITSGVIQPVP